MAYPFGVIGPILCFYFLTRKVKPSFAPRPARFHMREITIKRLPEGGGDLSKLMELLPAGIHVSSVRQARPEAKPVLVIDLE